MRKQTLVNFFFVLLFVRRNLCELFIFDSYRLAWILFNRTTTIGKRIDRGILSNKHQTLRVENKEDQSKRMKKTDNDVFLLESMP